MPIPIDDNSFTGQYIRSIENPDSVGYNQGRWYKPAYKGYDPNNRGFGVDIKYNRAASKAVQGREGKWLSEAEERQLRNDHLNYSKEKLDKWTPQVLRNAPSEAKQAMALGMLYRGEGAKTILNNPSLRDAYYGGTDKEFGNAVSNYYQKKGLKERATRSTQFLNSHHPNSLTSWNWEQPEFKPKNIHADGGGVNSQIMWKDLSLSQKSQLMSLFLRNGIDNINTMQDVYDNRDNNSFADGGIKDDTGSVGSYIDGAYQNAPIKMPFGLADNGDQDAVMTYDGGAVLPEQTVTPEGNYVDNTYDNIKIEEKHNKPRRDMGFSELMQSLRGW